MLVFFRMNYDPAEQIRFLLQVATLLEVLSVEQSPDDTVELITDLDMSRDRIDSLLAMIDACTMTSQVGNW